MPRHDPVATKSLSSVESFSSDAPGARSLLDETLRCLLTVTQCRGAAVLETGSSRRVLATAGASLEELGLRISSSALRMREPLWIADASVPNPYVRATAPLAVVLYPVRGAVDGSARAVVLVRERGEMRQRELQSTIAAFARLIDATASGASQEREENAVPFATRDAVQALVDSLSDLAWMKDSESRFVAVNQSLATLVNRTPKEMLGKTDADFFPPEIAESYVRGDTVVLREGRPFFTVEQIVDGSGNPHWVETIKNPVRDEQGNIIGATGVARDVTARQELEIERRRLVDELARERNRLQDMIANVPGVVWEEMFDGSYRFVSEQVETLLGYTVEEYLSGYASFLELVHEDDRAAVEQSNAAIVASREGGSHAFRMRRKDGTYIWCESHCRVMTDAGGRVIGLRGVSIDVTLRKQAEEQLRASEQHFRDLADVTPVMIFTTDARGDSEFQNRRLLDFVGESAESLKGKGWRGWIHPEDRECVLRIWKEAHERRRWLSLEGRYRRFDGEYRDLLVEATPRYTSDGSFAGFVGTCIDLTDRRSLEQRLEQERQLTSLGRLAATIAHEINNVLMGIQPFAEVIGRAPSASSLERAAGHIANSVQRGRRITHEILRFASTSDPVRLPLEVRPWLEQIGEELTSVLGPGVELVLDIPDSIRMFADRHQMTQVLTNLASNARDAMGGNGTFTIAARLESSWPRLQADGEPFVHLMVSDTGPGIPAEMIDRIFEPLFTTKPTGTGLGLAIVRDVIRRHHGDVVVENVAGSGATFHLIVSATDDVPAPLNGVSNSLPALVRRILLVEDDETVALGVATLLELDGIEVAVATCGADAIGAIEGFRPDVVALDIGLPDVPGTVVFEQIRRRWPDLPVLFSTGHAGELESGVEHLDGPTGHLLKPHDFDTFVRAVRRLFGASE